MLKITVLIVVKTRELAPKYIINHGRFSIANMRFCSVSEPPLLRFFENAIPTWEKRRSTEADDAGQPRYCRAITARLGNLS